MASSSCVLASIAGLRMITSETILSV
ncbi:hypothetical protein NC653_009829 [Populus alba x Populus x berolinensis]|uniref:Uncharacterized protein n=1 Tax=Populus alba x Populus x berolinensis TaxID=444605 RepID=A0AAD6RA05_9ROSI|nr:hypothetical protein NC653_009829 [Populus alba x Populus x berolinensis]